MFFSKRHLQARDTMDLRPSVIFHKLGYLRWIGFLIGILLLIFKTYAWHFPFDIEFNVTHHEMQEWREREEALRRFMAGTPKEGDEEKTRGYGDIYTKKEKDNEE